MEPLIKDSYLAHRRAKWSQCVHYSECLCVCVRGEGGREGGREEGRKGGREEGREGGRKGGREGGREEGRKGGRKGGGREGGEGGREELPQRFPRDKDWVHRQGRSYSAGVGLYEEPATVAIHSLIIINGPQSRGLNCSD